MDANSRGRLENGDGNNEVGREDDVLVPVDGEAVGGELLAEDIEGSRNVFWPFVDDIEIGVSLDKAAGGGTDGS